MTKIINYICYAISILCIIGGTTISIVAIWSTLDDALFWKALSTLGVLFLASILTPTVNNILIPRDKQ